ncbi:hypothetical protein ASPZODRAFT_1104119 [Penicilliopsis zonata CBS 506.65]|uniref:Uncharacterized protein n=1 Tax=Penicilliopsis zonata CBS 506.65 TaxID=1073090 RepID=A0A1L9SSD6_9EURO|nr:hypothetical protein ASPZODRAFT_1104119 [Penicilliopsis zonata CBS 506.65]OJJ50089.1 hypothetical protein ASPZODRAFT_1104119 [Penicilliopsis zonata CBS 506.65]
MAASCFTGQQLDNDLVILIASLLNAANVPNILWGNYLLTIYGVPTVVDGVSFIVPDESIDISFSTLSEAGFLPCSQGLECQHSNSPYCKPYKHLHIDDELEVSLFRESDLLWEFPDLKSSQYTDPNIISASDERLPSATLGRGRGRFLCPSPVRIPSPVRYCEALIFLLCRDYETVRRSYWMALLTYLVEYVDGMDIFNEEDLRDGFRQFYHALKMADPVMFSFLKGLRETA